MCIIVIKSGDEIKGASDLEKCIIYDFALARRSWGKFNFCFPAQTA